MRMSLKLYPTTASSAQQLKMKTATFPVFVWLLSATGPETQDPRGRGRGSICDPGPD